MVKHKIRSNIRLDSRCHLTIKSNYQQKDMYLVLIFLSMQLKNSVQKWGRKWKSNKYGWKIKIHKSNSKQPPLTINCHLKKRNFITLEPNNNLLWCMRFRANLPISLKHYSKSQLVNTYWFSQMEFFVVRICWVLRTMF